MNPLKMKLDHTTSQYVKTEFEKIQTTLAPYIKKSSLYTLVSVPILTFSLMNLFVLIVNMRVSEQTMTPIIAFGIAAAFGLALFKESMYQSKEIYLKSFDYITNRIKKNDELPDTIKDRYLKRLQTEPANTMTIYYEFLQQEERIKKMEGLQ
ncbi:DUF5392 family protein [Salipaludibacillus agaradhaerens]|jgi:hypothetical protein|uniref:YwnF family protein n=1 Tax=Salipaludibacillus agaradhaerens TaxID=76935 RepID=UPI0021519AF8|nr:YwnF family protein [Salipaludibacillus agaradhaerens]MCR6106709.1 DUF5392 family protein [Salipaludibacillus agaradhaerens]MCR6118742.1 DUF5392 family protein [Salipaludibacillus agaradhaerens]UJW57821.1 DUF5392 family protein [Bacillus sp. A116_S68]